MSLASGIDDPDHGRQNDQQHGHCYQETADDGNRERLVHLGPCNDYPNKILRQFLLASEHQNYPFCFLRPSYCSKEINKSKLQDNFVAGMVFTQCQKTDISSPYDVNLANSTSLGSILTDRNGNTLYFFALDANGLNNCATGCTTN